MSSSNTNLCSSSNQNHNYYFLMVKVLRHASHRDMAIFQRLRNKAPHAVGFGWVLHIALLSLVPAFHLIHHTTNSLYFCMASHPPNSSPVGDKNNHPLYIYQWVWLVQSMLLWYQESFTMNRKNSDKLCCNYIFLPKSRERFHGSYIFIKLFVFVQAHTWRWTHALIGGPWCN